MTDTIPPREGGFFWTRDNHVRGPMRRDADGDWTDGINIWNNDGSHRISTIDLVAVADVTPRGEEWGEWVVDRREFQRNLEAQMVEYDATGAYVRHCVRRPAPVIVEAFGARWRRYGESGGGGMSGREGMVRGLVWRQTANNHWEAGDYSVNQKWPHNNGPFTASAYVGGRGAYTILATGTLEAAQAACQADYTARILAALDPAWLERVERMEAFHDSILAAADRCDGMEAHQILPHLWPIICEAAAERKRAAILAPDATGGG